MVAKACRPLPCAVQANAIIRTAHIQFPSRVQKELSAVKACQLHFGPVGRCNFQQSAWVKYESSRGASKYLKSDSPSIQRCAFRSFQRSPAGQQAGWKRNRDQAGAPWLNRGAHESAHVGWPQPLEDSPLRHVKSHLWLFVNCRLVHVDSKRKERLNGIKVQAVKLSCVLPCF